MDGRERLANAARGEPVDRPPVWLMRQAGRVLPEYRAIRAEHSFLTCARDPALATEISLQPFRRFGMDGVVVFSDIMLPLAGLGLDLDFQPGPVIANPITCARDLQRLEGDVRQAIEPTAEAIRRLRGEVGENAAVLGFAGAPWTLAAYASEERLSRDVVGLTSLSYRDADLMDEFLERMARISAETLSAQIDAGADAVQLFDTWAGVLDEARYERFAGRAIRRVLEHLPRDRPPVILYARAAAHLVDALVETGVDVVSLDWRVDLGEIARRHGKVVSLQGNLDPAALMGSRDAIERQVADLVEQGRPARGHILNLGHGIQPQTPVAGVEAFVRAVQQVGTRGRSSTAN